MNRGLYRNYGIKVTEDKLSWIYYQNLAGIKHPTNKDIIITYLENNESAPLTKERMLNSPLTRKTLLGAGDKFKELCATYPGEEVYIRGCLYDIDIKTAINAPAGTILGYNKCLVETQEYSFIPELQEYIYNFLSRWHVREYTLTDDLYLPSMLGILYASLPNKIMNIRNKYSLTAEAHTFHLQNFFESHMNIWNEVRILKKETQYWLYKNLRWMMKHVGKGETFHKLAWKILETNNIGIGKYNVQVPDFDDRLLNNRNIKQSSYFKPTSIVQTEKLNDAYDIGNRADTALDNLVAREMQEVDIIETPTYTGRIDYMVEQEVHDVNESRLLKQGTKVLDLLTVKLFLSRGIDPFQIAVDYWAYLVKEGKFDFGIDYRDANTEIDIDSNISAADIDATAAQTYYINPKQGLLMLLKVLLKATGQLTKPLTTLNISSVVNDDREYLKTIASHLWDDYVKPWGDDNGPGMYSTIIDHIPDVPVTITSTDTLQKYISDILDYHTYNWYIDSNTENVATMANFKNFNARSIKHMQLELSDTPKTIDQLLKEEGIDYVLPDIFNMTTSMRGLFKAFIGFDLSGTDDILDNLKMYRSLVDKLTSYTTQVITTSNEDENTYINYNHLSVLRSKPIMTITGSRLHPIEHNIANLNTYADDFRDNHEFLNLAIPTTMVFECRRPINGHMAAVYLDDKETHAIYRDMPNMTISVIDIPNRDITGCPYTDIFLTIVKATFKPIEDWPEDNLLRATGLYINEALDTKHINLPRVVSYDAPNTLVYELNRRQAIKGKMSYYPQSDNGMYAHYSSTPDLLAVVSDVPNYEMKVPELQDEFLFVKKATFHSLERYAPDGRRTVIELDSLGNNVEDKTNNMASAVVMTIKEMSRLDNTIMSVSAEVNDGIHPKYYVGQSIPKTAKDLAMVTNVTRRTNELEAYYNAPRMAAIDAPLSSYQKDEHDIEITKSCGIFRIESPDLSELVDSEDER